MALRWHKKKRQSELSGGSSRFGLEGTDPFAGGGGHGLRAEVHAGFISARADARHTRTRATTTRCPARGPPQHGRVSRLDLLWADL